MCAEGKMALEATRLVRKKPHLPTRSYIDTRDGEKDLPETLCQRNSIDRPVCFFLQHCYAFNLPPTP